MSIEPDVMSGLIDHPGEAPDLAPVDLRMRFFGGSVNVGAARPLDRDGQWRFVWGLAGGI